MINSRKSRFSDGLRGGTGGAKTALQGGYIPCPLRERGLGKAVEPSLAKRDGVDRKRQHCRAVTSFPLMVKGKAWLGVKDPPAGEGQVGQKHLFGKGGTGRIEKRGYILSSLTFLPTGAEVFFTSFFS